MNGVESLRAVVRFLSRFGPEAVQSDGSILPAAHLRLCGPEFGADRVYLASAEREANRLVRDFGLTSQTRLLDLGCGTGRLPIGLLRTVGEMEAYWGVDVVEHSVRWCQRHIGAAHPGFQFVHVPVHNARYNPAGAAIDQAFQLPFTAGTFELIYLYSVFSHMEESDVRVYLHEFARLLTADGQVFLTGFFERDVAPVEINPVGYRLAWSGPLHGVRYEQSHFAGLCAEAGLRVARLDYQTETNGQSAVALTRA